MLAIFVTVYCLLFTVLAIKYFRLALALFIIVLPSYLIRFTIPAPAFLVARHIPGLPTTLLELMFGILFTVWLLTYFKSDWPALKHFFTAHRFFFFSFFFFLVSSIVSIFVSDMWWYSLGQWRAYFLEPLMLFSIIIARSISSQKPLTSTLLWSVLLSTLPVSLFGVIQFFTGWHVGNADVAALASHRITSFFLSPNAVALYLVPSTLISFALIPTIAQYTGNKKVWAVRAFSVTSTVSLIAIFLTQSIGGWCALFVGALVFGWKRGYKKVSLGLLACALMLITTTLYGGSLQSSKGQSANNRLLLWSYTSEFLTASPKNFIFGGGVGQFFRKVQKPHYNKNELERLIYPHTIFLNFWTEIGLPGLASFLGIYYFLLSVSYSLSKKGMVGAACVATLIAFFAHGLIDVPYFKNDLAMLFWIMAGIVFSEV